MTLVDAPFLYMLQNPFGSTQQMAEGELDAEALQRLRRFGGDALLRELIALFREIGPQRLHAARQALASSDADGVRRNLHALKSSGAQLGASRIQRLSEQGEQSAAAGELGAVAALLDALDAELAVVLRKLDPVAVTP